MAEIYVQFLSLVFVCAIDMKLRGLSWKFWLN
jgi:hypothetical protein